MEEDLEKAFEDDIDNISDYESDGEDFLAESIARLKMELLNEKPNESDKDADQNHEWDEFMESIKLNNPVIENSVGSATTSADTNALQLPSSLTSKISCSEDNISSSPANMFIDVEILDEVREVLFFMLDSVEYIAGIEYDMTEQLADESASPGPDVGDFVEKELLPVNMISEFEESSVEVADADVEEELTPLLYDDLLLHEKEHKRHLQMALEDIELQMKRKSEEYQREVDEDRKLREERRARIMAETKRMMIENKASTAIQKCMRGYNTRKGYRTMLYDQQRMKDAKREREERNRMSIIEAQSRAAWEYQHQLELKRLQLEQAQISVDKKLMDAEDVLGGLLRMERRREQKNREIMATIDAESAASQTLFNRIAQQDKEAKAQRIKDEEKKAADEKERVLAAEIVEEKKRIDREAAQKEERSKQGKNIKESRKNHRGGDQVSSGGAKGGKLSERGGGGFGGIIPKTIDKVRSLWKKNDSAGADKHMEDEEGDPEGERDMSSDGQQEGTLMGSSDSFDSVVTDGKISHCSDEPKECVQSETKPLVRKVTPVSTEMIRSIEDAVHAAVTQSQISVRFKSTLDDTQSTASQTPYTPSSTTSDGSLFDFVVSVREKQQHEMICVALKSWKSHRQSESTTSKRDVNIQKPVTIVQQRSLGKRSELELVDSEMDAYMSREVDTASTSQPISRHNYAEKKQRELKMSVEGLSSIDFVRNYPNLSILDVNVNRIANLDSLVETKCALEELYLKDNVLTCIKGVSGVSSLRVLNLEANQLTDLSPLESLPNLVHLSASMNRLSAVPLLTSSKLQKLELYHNRICSFSPDSLRHLVSLTHLDLGRNKLTVVSGEALSQCQLLSQLVLSQNQITEVPSPLYLPNLRNLWLSGNKLCNLKPWAAGATEGTWPVFLPMLERLYLQDNTMRHIETNCFASSPFLADVDLSFNNIGSLQHMSGILECPLIQVLQLQDNPINSDALAMYYVRTLLSELKELSGQTISRDTLPDPPSEEPDIDKDKHMSIMMSMHRHAGWTTFKNRKLGLTTKTQLKTAMPTVPFWKLRSKKVRELIQCLSGLLTEQNIARTLDRAAPQQGETLTKSTTNSFVDVLQKHCDILLSWDADAPKEHTITIRNVFDFEMRTDEAGNNVKRSDTGSIVSARRRGSRESHSLHNARHSHAALRIQSLFRGQSTRKRLKRILHSVAYQDDELDAMLGDGDNMFAEYEGFLGSTAPELEDGWLQPRQDGKASDSKYDGNSDDDEYNAKVSSAGSEGSFVYGDHRRRRNHKEMPVNTDGGRFELKPTTPTGPNERASPRANLSSLYKNEWVAESSQGMELHDAGVYINRPNSSVRHQRDGATRQNDAHLPDIILSRAESSATMNSSRPASRSSNLSDTSSSRFGLGNYDMEEDADMLLHTARSRVSTGSEQASEWGISDPAVVDAMMKRNKRLKHFADAKDRRERERDPTVRLQKFMKSAAPPTVNKGNTNVSGAFGGKPKRVRNTRPKKSAAPPAWMLGSDQDEK